jgi:predicted deacylase
MPSSSATARNNVVELVSERFESPEPGPHVLIIGGVHGDEFEPMAAIRRLIERLRERPPLRGRVTLVPVVNEAAYRRCHRAAEDGLDLARTCPGRADGSITERTAHAISALIRTADLFIDLHTGGSHYRVLPLSGYMLHADPKVLDVQRRMARVFGLPIIWGTEPNLNGRTLSIARDAGVPSIYTEYEGGGGCDPAGITAYFDGCLRVLREFQLIADAPPLPATAPLVVEDATPDSGHMQTKHPSPCEGFFEPVVTIGDRVRVGDTLGSVTDLLGRRREPIIASTSGIVLTLHTFSRVEANEGLVVVLPQSC